MYVKSFKELIVWQRSMELVFNIYKVTKSFPRDELYGLVSQMRRSAVSIPSNIAEGKKRSTKKDFCHFLCIADGSAAELETQVLIAKREYTVLDFTLIEKQLMEVQKMLSSIIQKLKSSKS